MLDFIPPDRLQSLHDATSNILPEAKIIFNSLNASDSTSQYMFETQLRRRIKEAGLSDNDSELMFNAVMEELNPTKPRLSPSDFQFAEDF